jgi:hypothetical protein
VVVVKQGFGDKDVGILRNITTHPKSAAASYRFVRPLSWRFRLIRPLSAMATVPPSHAPTFDHDNIRLPQISPAYRCPTNGLYCEVRSPFNEMWWNGQ